MDLERAVSYTPNHPFFFLKKAPHPTDAHDGLVEGDALSLHTACRDRKLGCLPYRCMAITSTHRHTGGGMCVCVANNVYVLLVGGACRGEHSYNRTAR